ncbi:hypothetical protein EG333_19390 [Pectobacterium versatile]|nr:hypothetical protein EG333_19390 [Pectobacterium versatile]
MPSTFMPAVRTTSDAFPTRRWLSRHPCRSSGGHVRLCVILYARNIIKMKRLNAECCRLFWKFIRFRGGM